MKIEAGDLLTIEEKQYLTIDVILFEGINYLFSNEIANDQPTKQYVIFKQEDDEVEEVEDPKMIEVLFPIFSGNIQKLIEETKMIEKYEID